MKWLILIMAGLASMPALSEEGDGLGEEITTEIEYSEIAVETLAVFDGRSCRRSAVMFAMSSNGMPLLSLRTVNEVPCSGYGSVKQRGPGDVLREEKMKFSHVAGMPTALRDDLFALKYSCPEDESLYCTKDSVSFKADSNTLVHHSTAVNDSQIPESYFE